jgi:hypothetical protein
MLRLGLKVLSLAGLWLAGLSLAGASTARAQTTGQAIADAATFAAVATLAPLCGLRDEAWSADLRQAAMQGGAQSKQVEAALGYGEMEALEDLAADKPEATCAALRQNPALRRGDAAVEAFRHRRDGKPVG